MTATVLAMSDHRAVFMLPERAGTVVFIATRGQASRFAHERWFDCPGDASTYADHLSQRFGCVVVGPSRPASRHGEHI